MDYSKEYLLQSFREPVDTRLLEFFEIARYLGAIRYEHGENLRLYPAEAYPGEALYSALEQVDSTLQQGIDESHLDSYLSEEVVPDLISTIIPAEYQGHVYALLEELYPGNPHSANYFTQTIHEHQTTPQ